MQVHPKRPNETVGVVFDMRPFIAAAEGRTIAEYSILGAPGITVPRVTVAGSVFTVQVAGGLDRWNYELAFQAIGSDGVVELDVREIQVRGVVLGLINDGSSIATSYILSETGERLISEAGDRLLYS